MNKSTELKLWGGHYDGGKFIRFVSEIRDGKSYSTGFQVEDFGASSITEASLKAKLSEAEAIGIKAAAEKYPQTFRPTR